MVGHHLGPGSRRTDVGRPLTHFLGQCDLHDDSLYIERTISTLEIFVIHVNPISLVTQCL